MNDHPQGESGTMSEDPALGDPGPVPEGLWARLVQHAVNAPPDPAAAALLPESPPPSHEDAHLDFEAADVDTDTGGDDPLQSVFPDDAPQHPHHDADLGHAGHDDYA